MEDLNNEQTVGIVKISDEVISVIAGIAAGEIEGITVCAQGVTNNITNKIFKGKKLPEKATKVQLEGDKANIELSVAVEYGTKIKEAVEKLDSLSEDERMQRIADLREKAILDEKAIYAKGLDDGIKEE